MTQEKEHKLDFNTFALFAVPILAILVLLGSVAIIIYRHKIHDSEDRQRTAATMLLCNAYRQWRQETNYERILRDAHTMCRDIVEIDPPHKD